MPRPMLLRRLAEGRALEQPERRLDRRADPEREDERADPGRAAEREADAGAPTSSSAVLATPIRIPRRCEVTSISESRGPAPIDAQM